MKYWTSIFIGLILLSSMLSNSFLITTSDTIPVIDYPINLRNDYNTSINIFVDPEIQSENIDFVISDLNSRVFNQVSPIGFTTSNHLQITKTVISSEDRNSFVDYLHSIEDTSSPNGHEFNSTAYDEGRSNVFTNITGRSYDAEDSLNWISNNLWDGSSNKFSLYLFNLTELDDGMDHWFTINPIDSDIGAPQSTFFSGTSGLIHGKSVSAWGGHAGLPIHFIDFSTETWWGDFIEHIYSGFGFSADIISHKLQDFSTLADKDDFMGDYLRSFIEDTYDLRLFSQARLGRSVKVESLVLFDWYEYGYSIDESQWILDSNMIESEFESAFPYLDFNITDTWNNLSLYNGLVTEMEKYKVLQPDGTYHLELYSGLYQYISNVFIRQNFNFTGEDIILPNLVFLLNNTEFTAGGIPIAGISGYSFQIQGLIPNRYINSNGDRLRGFSDVILHEVGHSLGLPHPFRNGDGWAGDFSASVMGYYTSAPKFSQYDINAMGYYHSSSYLLQAEYAQTENTVSDPLTEFIDNWIAISRTAQTNWDFNRSVTYSTLALCGYASLYDIEDEHCDDFDIDAITSSDINSPRNNDDISDENGFNILSTPLLSVIVILLILPITYRIMKRDFQ